MSILLRKISGYASTELGKIISQFLETNFPRIMDIGFTALMEDELELIADNKKSWKLLLKEFWDQFLPVVTTAERSCYPSRDNRYRMFRMSQRKTC